MSTFSAACGIAGGGNRDNPAGGPRRGSRAAGNATQAIIIVSSPQGSSRPANRLAGEPSPYLLQHQFNPVDWYPWGPEAFARARTENRLIFLSIGYSTCHWCHVMERECFENEAIARQLNAGFVSIKVDREERPDVDKVYMTFVQATAGQGGWPLTVFLTPTLEPVYGGTYFPPEDRHGRPGLPHILQRLEALWQERPDEVRAAAADIRSQLAEYAQRSAPTPTALSPATLTRAAAVLLEDYDARHGGFGDAPKFPRPAHPAFLLRRGVAERDEACVRAVLHTCEAMAAGGIRDHLGGGFARYAVDARWLVPHFEKMLYDNAQLATLYLDAHRVSGKDAFANVAREILDYVQRDLTDPAGGFYSAEDADSEGREGKFYCWTLAELQQILTPEEARVAVRYFGVTKSGNFLDHSDPDPLPGQNVLSIVDPRLAPDEAEWLASAIARMRETRARRIRPQRDDKVLASWNGLMLEAFARAYGVLGTEAYLHVARRNLAFIQEQLWDASTRTLHHRWRAGARDDVQLLNAYAFLLGGVIELYQVTLEAPVLTFAVELAEAMLARFHDPADGGFWLSPAGADDILVRAKEDYDGAEPSGNSVAAQALLRLAVITGRADFEAAGSAAVRRFADRLNRAPHAVPCLLGALDFMLAPPRRVVIAGTPDAPATRSLIRAAHALYRPTLVVMGTAGPVDDFARTLPARDGEATAYACSGTSCQQPTTDPAELRRQLER